MDALCGQRLLAGRGVQLADDLAGRPDRGRLSLHLEHVSSRGDLDPEPVLELAQVPVERTAEVRESLVVRGLEENVGFSACWRHDQWLVSVRVWGMDGPARRRAGDQGTAAGAPGGDAEPARDAAGPSEGAIGPPAAERGRSAGVRRRTAPVHEPAPQRVRERLDDRDVDERARELGRAGEVHHPVVLRAPAQLLRVLLRRPFHEHPGRAAHHRPRYLAREPRDPRLEPGEPLALHVEGYGVGKLRRRGAGARAVDERERGVEADGVDEIHRGVEIGVGLAGEAHDEVRGQAQIGARGTQAVEPSRRNPRQCSCASSARGSDRYRSAPEGGGGPPAPGTSS